MQVALLLLMIIACAISGGCATMRNKPDQMIEVNDRLASLKADYENKIKAFKEEEAKRYHASNKKEKTRVNENLKRMRNEIVDISLLAIDLNFLIWERELLRQGAGKDVFFSGAAIATDLWATLSPALSTAKIISGIKTGIDSTKLSVNKDVFFQKTIDALLITMKGNRAKKLVEIERDMKEDDIDTYPLREAERDLLQYYEAGTIAGALSGIVLEAGEKKKEAKEKKEEIKSKPKTSQVTIKGLKGPEAIKLAEALNQAGAVVLAKTPKGEDLYDVSARFRKEDLPRKITIIGLDKVVGVNLKGALEKTEKFKDISVSEESKDGLCIVTAVFGEGEPLPVKTDYKTR
ncbi:MAG: hypothetical protein C4567_13930 [Deltaproteobacteria bacterium]|nr:MAG: hypothetical protein C4567_13930 [Deltaproteobacteria bacterium]